MTSRAGLPLTGLPIALVTLFLAFGADASRAEPSEINSIHAGATSIQFVTFGGGYTSPFTTNGIYLKTHFSDRGALRIGTDFYFNETSGESPPELPQRTRDDQDYSYTVSAEIQQYVDTRGPVTIFFGFGPFWKRANFRALDTQRSTYLGITYYQYAEYESRNWTIGGSAAAGFEWFFKRKLSVLGRVGASVGFGEQRNGHHYLTTDQFGTVLDDRRDRVDSDTATASSSSAALGFGIYF
jgi:hypothetical protein